MRHGPALLFALCTCLLLGCNSSQPILRTSTWLERVLQPAGPTGPDTIQMDVALVERPLGDGYINGELWNSADEQVVALESKAIIEDNGFRVGQIGGITPAGLQTLLTSERSCANPRRLRSRAGKPTRLILGPEMALCRFQILRDGGTVQVALEKAQCTLEVTGTLANDGHTRLRFVPQILHGDTRLLPRPASDRSGWILGEDRPTDRYPQLAWEVSLAPNEYVLVGGRYDRPETLGHQCFLRGDEQNPVQRLLVIRTSRPGKDLDPPLPVVSGEAPGPYPVSIATHAALTSARGNSR
jgi:hypothetical protein